MKYLFLFFIFIYSVSAFAQTPTSQPVLENLFSVKETFRYEVKYGFFKLGWVEVSLLPDTMYNGKLHKHLFTKIESNSRIPFMGKEVDHFHSFFYENEDGLPVTSYYWKDNIDEDELKEITYSFDRENGVVTYKEEDNTRDTLKLEEPATAGHIIFYFSRLFAGGEVENTMPVYVTKKAGSIHFKNPSKLEKRKYAAFDKPVQAFLTKGSTENIEGPFGFSGEFRAWFLDDDLRVPLEARVKVFLGNAIVRLIEYRREEL
ncbi:MAG: hypothetical protein BalsKO_06510 [Balneolaceae bacterium]